MTNDAKIPFLDLVSPHAELQEELVAAFREALKNAAFIGGPMVEGLEREFGAFCDARFCVGVGSGTDALRFALAAAGVCPGESVITVPNTFIATTEAISQVGALPEFVDVEERTSTMDPDKLRTFLETECEVSPAGERLVSRRTGRLITAIIPVHLYGHPADMDPIMVLAERYSLIVIEDACQAHGAEYFSTRNNRWMKAGSMGRAAAFSFYPGKNLGACGEAGAITRTTRRSRASAACFGTTDRPRSTITMLKATTDGSIRFRLPSSGSNSNICQSGMSNAGSGRKFTKTY